MIAAMPPEAVPQSRASRGARPALRWATLPRGLVRVGILLAAVTAASGCGGGYREKVIPAKEFTPLVISKFFGGKAENAGFSGADAGANAAAGYDERKKAELEVLAIQREGLVLASKQKSVSVHELSRPSLLYPRSIHAWPNYV
jgi:hypothetical protein